MISAGTHAPLRSNDAIHLAVAIRLGVDELVTDDQELADAATSAGLTVLAPSDRQAAHRRMDAAWRADRRPVRNDLRKGEGEADPCAYGLAGCCRHCAVADRLHRKSPAPVLAVPVTLVHAIVVPFDW